MYPAPAIKQGLYEASTTRRHILGSVQSFDTDLGVVEAVYVQNNNAASIAIGHAVAAAAVVSVANAFVVDTAALANVSAARAPGMVYGVLCASMQGTATSLGGGGYAWAACRGPITCGQFAASYVSNVFSFVTVNSAAQLELVATSQGSVVSVLGPAAIIGQIGATASTISRASAGTGGSAGSFVTLLWR